MKNTYVLCDTNIFISALLGKPKTIDTLKNKIGLSNIVISSVTYMELCRGALNKEQLNTITKNLRAYKILNFNENVSVLAMDYIKTYHLNHGLQIPDAIIAATSVAYNIPLFTYNIKDFKFIKEMKLFNF